MKIIPNIKDHNYDNVKPHFLIIKINALIFLTCLIASFYFIVIKNNLLLFTAIGGLSTAFILMIYEFKPICEFINYYIKFSKDLDFKNNINSIKLSNDHKLFNYTTFLSKPITLINLSEFKDTNNKRQIIICESYEDANDCSIFLNKNGYSWSSGDSYLDNSGWSITAQDNYIGYIFNEGTFIRFNNFNEINWDNYIVNFWHKN